MKATVALSSSPLLTRLAEALFVGELVLDDVAVVDTFDALSMLGILSSPSTRTNAIPL